MVTVTYMDSQLVVRGAGCGEKIYGREGITNLLDSGNIRREKGDEAGVTERVSIPLV